MDMMQREGVKMNELERIILGNRSLAMENMWANVFHDTIRGSRWLREQPFSPGRAAIGYPALYALYRVLDEFQPENILELGLGQSTRMIGEYVKWKEEKGEQCHHYVVEHDPDWIAFFKKSNNYLGDSSEIIQLDLLRTEFDDELSKEETYVNLYKGFTETFSGKKFDFIFIDGPFGSPLYSRMDIIDILPDCLEDSFILMLDDAERTGELNTLQMIENIMHDSRIPYAVKNHYYAGLKSTAVLTSRNLHFFCTM